jgi:hypothetical protein
MDPPNSFAAPQIGDRAGDAPDADVAARGQHRELGRPGIIVACTSTLRASSPRLATVGTVATTLNSPDRPPLSKNWSSRANLANATVAAHMPLHEFG